MVSHKTRTSSLAAILAILVTACSTKEREPVPLPTTVAEQSALPAGRTVFVRFVDELSSETGRNGQVFRAVTLFPVEAADGTMIASAGSAVTGHLVAVDSVSGTLRFRLDSIETVRGSRPLAAVLAPHQSDPTLRAVAVGGSSQGNDVIVSLTPPGAREAIGGGPPDPTAVTETRGQNPVLRIDSRTAVELLLTAPLFAR